MSALAHEIDLDVSKLVLDVANKRAKTPNVAGAILDGSIERTIDGASTLTLTLHDPQRELLRSGVFGGAGNKINPVDVRLDRLWWRLVQVSKSGDDLTLTFEDREVALLRLQASPRKASRASVTRAEFALSLVREAGRAIPFVCPELHVKQKIAIETERQQTDDTARATQKEKGLAVSTPGLLIRNSPATASQKANAERCLDVASSLNAPAKATLALIEAVIVESNITNPTSESADGFGSTGILQVRHVTAGPLGIDPLDIEACCNTFLTRGFTGRGGAIQLARSNPGMSAGQIAQACQGSAYPTRYDEHEAEAQAFVDAYGGGGAYTGDSAVTTTKTTPYQFQRGGTDGKRENSWDCLQRLGQEVNWRCFVSAGVVYFISERTLIQSKVRFWIDEDTPGVTAIDFDVDSGKQSDQVTVTCRASRWLGAPGAVVALQRCGPASGRWLIQSLRRGLFDAQATITLKRASPPLGEPAPETTTSTLGAGTTITGDLRSGVVAASGSTAIDSAYSAAKSIHAKRFPYVWGGGHARVGVADGGTGRDSGIGFDCSGSTCAVLAGGQMGYQAGGSADVSGTMAANWGEAGEGQLLTVWANAVHVWMEFKIGGKPQHFGTGDWGKGWGGAGFNPNMHFKNGFTPRHWPGT